MTRRNIEICRTEWAERKADGARQATDEVYPVLKQVEDRAGGWYRGAISQSIHELGHWLRSPNGQKRQYSVEIGVETKTGDIESVVAMCHFGGSLSKEENIAVLCGPETVGERMSDSDLLELELEHLNSL